MELRVVVALAEYLPGGGLVRGQVGIVVETVRSAKNSRRIFCRGPLSSVPPAPRLRARSLTTVPCPSDMAIRVVTRPTAPAPRREKSNPPGFCTAGRQRLLEIAACKLASRFMSTSRSLVAGNAAANRVVLPISSLSAHARRGHVRTTLAGPQPLIAHSRGGQI